MSERTAAILAYFDSKEYKHIPNWAYMWECLTLVRDGLLWRDSANGHMTITYNGIEALSEYRANGGEM